MADATPPTLPTPVANKLGTAFAPDDLLGGTTVEVGGNPGDLQAKLVASADPTCALTLAGVHRGNTYVCQPGAVYSTVTIPAVLASDTGWTRIISSGALPNAGLGHQRVSESHAAQMFKVWSVDGGPTNPSAAALKFLNASRGWIFVGMEATHNSAVTQRSAIFADPTLYNPDGSFQATQVLARLIFDRCIAHPAPGEGGSQGLWAVDIDDLQVWDSWMEGRTINGEDILDSQGIYCRRGNRSHLENNELRATSECLLIGDQDAFGHHFDCTILRNHIFKPLTWQKFLDDGVSINPSWDGVNWNIKNSFEIKAATRLRFEGNLCENVWCGQGDQPGDMLILNGGEQVWGAAIGIDCLIQSNKFVNGVNAFAFNMAGGGVPHTRCALLNNLFLDIRGHVWNFGWKGIDIWCEHNTVVPANAVGSNFSNFVNYIQTGSVAGVWPRLTLKRNIWGGSQYGVTVIPDPPAAPTSGVWNTYLGTPGTPTGREFAENAELRGTSGSPTSYPGGITVYADAAAAGINLTDGKLASNSPLKNASSESPPRDLGVDHDVLESAMGTPGPPVASFQPVQTMGTRTVVFQDTSV